MYLDTIFARCFVSKFLLSLLHLLIQDTKIHIPYLEIIYVYVCRIKESAAFCIQFCIFALVVQSNRWQRGIRVSAVASCCANTKFGTLLYVTTLPTPTRMGIDRSARDSPFKPEGGGFDPHQSSAVLGVKPAIEDVDMQFFLAFHCIIVENQIEPDNLLYNPAHD